MISLRERLEALEPTERSELVNQIKSESEGSDYYQLIMIEVKDTIDNHDEQLMGMTDSDKIHLLVGRLQGIKLIKSLIETKWRTDDA